MSAPYTTCSSILSAPYPINLPVTPDLKALRLGDGGRVGGGQSQSQGAGGAQSDF